MRRNTSLQFVSVLQAPRRTLKCDGRLPRIGLVPNLHRNKRSESFEIAEDVRVEPETAVSSSAETCAAYDTHGKSRRLVREMLAVKFMCSNTDAVSSTTL